MMKRCLVCGRHTLHKQRNYCSLECKTKKRPFRAWDGEGRTINGKHRLCLLANSDGEYIENYEEGLSTDECLEFLCRPRTKAYNVWFSFGYDVNKILQGLPLVAPHNSLEELWNTTETRYKHYHLSYLPRKIFSVSSKRGGTFYSYDTFGFFQTSFIKACTIWGLNASSVTAGKEARGNFESWTPQQIREYNFEELRLLVELMEVVRDALLGADLLPSSWHGPGAIAARWFSRNKMREHYAPYPREMRYGVMSAYFGGRIDVAAIGELEVYKYDLASAYPAAQRDCLSLTSLLEWEHRIGSVNENDRHALYRVRWNIENENEAWGPLPYRNHRGIILYPLQGEGWYWGVEVIAAERLFPGAITRLEAWYPIGQKTYPFKEPIERDYAARRATKNEGKKLALKLALNSLFGKTCQHEGHNGKKPTWQNYIWGGYITAHCRARILEAMATVGTTNVVAVATDGLFLRCPLPGADSTKTLGEWQDEGFVRLLLVSPGLYATIKGDESEAKIYRSRGLPSAINFGYVLRAWGCRTNLDTEGADSIGSKRPSFVGMGKALAQSDENFGEFIEEERKLKSVALFGTSKRFPDPFMYGVEGWKELPLLPKEKPPGMGASAPYRWRLEFNEREE